MRIPWYIYVPLCFIVPCVTLYICVKDNDIVTPPSLEETHDSVKLWKVGYPISEETVKKVKLGSTEKAPLPKPIPSPPEPKVEEEPIVPPKPVIDISSIKLAESSPSLEALTEQDLSVAQLMKYGDKMMTTENYQAARIAFERIIDHAKDSNTEDRKVAAKSILKLNPLTPLWNPDPTARKTLTIDLALNERFKDQHKRIIKQLKAIVINASDGTVMADVKLTSVKQEKENRTAQSTLRISQDTPLVTFTIQEVTDIDSKIPAALYYAVRSKNNQIQNRIGIPERPTDISALDALNSYITRLAWVHATTPAIVDPVSPKDSSPTENISE